MHDIQLALHGIQGALALMDARERAVYSRRLVAAEPLTLDELGQEFGVTRERIRQIEAEVVAKLRANGADEVVRFANLPSTERWVMHFSQLGDAETANFFAPHVGSALEVLRAVGLVEKWDGPWVSKGMKAIYRKVRGPYINYLVSQVAKNGPTLAEFTEQMVRLGLDEACVGQWLDDIGLQVSGKRVRSKSIGGAEYVRDLLEMAGKPLNWPNQIAPQLEGRWNPRGILGRIQEMSDVFTRVDVDDYGLAEWGLPQYEGIAREIEKLIERHGPLPVGLVVEHVTAKFDVSENSVRAYVRQGNLACVDGVVRFAESAAAPAVAPRLSQLHKGQLNGLTVLDGKFEYEMPVNHDRLRGSGMPVTTGLMAVIGLAKGQAATLPIANVAGHSLAFSWKGGGQPKLGSIRASLLEMGAVEGQRLVMTFDGAEGAIERVTMSLKD